MSDGPVSPADAGIDLGTDAAGRATDDAAEGVSSPSDPGGESGGEGSSGPSIFDRLQATGGGGSLDAIEREYGIDKPIALWVRALQKMMGADGTPAAADLLVGTLLFGLGQAKASGSQDESQDEPAGIPEPGAGGPR